jgi:transcriptional regulator with XRE-family HTH domain
MGEISADPPTEAGLGHTIEVMDSGVAPSTSDYIRQRRVGAGLSVDDLAQRAGVSPAWLASFEAGEMAEELTYDRLLVLVRATQPPRPEWWDDGHEHDLNLGPLGVPAKQTEEATDYWARIEAVRNLNRSAGGRR